MTMTAERLAPGDVATTGAETLPTAEPEAAADQPAKLHDILIINYSGELEKVWATMLLASTAGAMQVPCRVFVTFWGLQNFVKDEKRITGKNWMQKMMSMMSRPGISHRPLSKMNFLGMGPWMMGVLARQQKNLSPKELLVIAQEMGVEFIPCQMTMDMFGLTRDDLVEGMGEPVGAATVIGLMSEGSAPLFI
ncbi:MAG TPA: DsrE/DsrF/DrsH-like family protein [Candidatus Sulfomarinibacteraceae bacterium]|nr:DsrE/DsrF/DrsH-like family protein [Candidatus Sulfomarinibacteraceae bacterium]